LRAHRRALLLWEAGDYDRCLRALNEIPHGQHSSDSVLLQARVLIRAQRFDDAQAWLNENLLRHQSADALATHALLMGTVRACCGDYADADTWFAQARSHRAHRSILAETDYQQALASYQADDLATARRIVAGALRPIEDIIYVRARSLLGWICVASCSFEAAYREFTIALEALDTCRSRDAYLGGSLVYALSILSAECALGEPQALDERCAAIAWTPNMLGMQIQTLRHIGIAYARRGQSQRAALQHMAVAAAAEGTAWAMLGYAECGALAFSNGEPLAAHALAVRAATIADRIDAACGWNGIDGEQRLALLVLAELFARLDAGAEAQRYRERYRESHCSSLSALRHDPRLATFERHVEALVLGASGQRDRAEAALITVATEWERIGYQARGNEARADAERLAANAARAESAPRPERNAARSGLTLRDERVARMVARGLSDGDIARELSVSPRTARNIVHSLYPKFDVHTRTQLVIAVTASRA
jgi:DNA-binding CsgD family transcriptional regulator